ncbi:MAG: Re/Si-specific NAD(P)(+) transhydrogenase subunit alpha [Gammaproteobacteria bacterium]|nr:Re/Si-specific NAD(P)(+) transhydrogenase subunit alpha [Gammaproteobacteria bacterium]
MQIVAIRETWPGEQRAGLVPKSVSTLSNYGFKVHVESSIGLGCGYSDREYQEVGAEILPTTNELLAVADIVISVRRPSVETIRNTKAGTILISFLDPFREPDLIQLMADQGITAVSLEMLPRTTRAQRMDALSSQANVAGYAAVVVGAYHLPRLFPMMITAAGTITPARVFVIGAGVAGLQAIATARRLGARVEAFDTRPVVAEEVRSLGAKFVEFDVGASEQTKDGYAAELTHEQLEQQKRGMAKVIAYSDLVITTAQVFGRPAPRIISHEVLLAMKPGSVVIDMAVESGGNVEGSQTEQIVDIHGVKLIGFANLASSFAAQASTLYASNVVHFLEEFMHSEKPMIELDPNNEIAQGCVITRDGTLVKSLTR